MSEFFFTVQVRAKDPKADREARCTSCKDFAIPFRAVSGSGVVVPRIAEHVYEVHTDKVGFLAKATAKVEAPKVPEPKLPEAPKVEAKAAVEVPKADVKAKAKA